MHSGRLCKIFVAFYFLSSCCESLLNFKPQNGSNLAIALENLIGKIETTECRSFRILKPDGEVNFEIQNFFDEIFLYRRDDAELKTFRMESLYKIKNKRKTRNSFVIALFRFHEDLKEFFKKQTDNHFRMKGYFVFVLLRGGFNGYHKIFEFMWSMQAYNVVVMFENKNREVQVETFIPFNDKKCFDTSPVLVNKFVNGSFIKDIQNIFPNDMKNLFNCPIRVATSSTSEPFVYVKQYDNGTFNLYGRDIEFIETIAKVMNFKINYTFVGEESLFYNNKSSVGPLKALLDKGADFAIGDYWLRKSRLEFFDATDIYISDSLVIVIPPGADFGPFEKFLLPLTPETWFMVITVFCIACLAIFYIRRRSKATQTFVFGRNIRHPFLNMFIAFVGGTQKRLPTRNFARFLLMSFLMYSLVIRTAYQGAYYGFLKSNQQHNQPNTIDEMIDKDFRFYFFDWTTDFFADIEKLSSRATVIPRSDKDLILNKMDHSDFKGALIEQMAVLTLRVQTDQHLYESQICKEKFVFISSVIYAQKNFYLLEAFNQNIQTIHAAGLNYYWHSKFLGKSYSAIVSAQASKQPQVIKLSHLSGCFQVWAFGMMTSFVVFVIEASKKFFKRLFIRCFGFPN